MCVYVYVCILFVCVICTVYVCGCVCVYVEYVCVSVCSTCHSTAITQAGAISIQDKTTNQIFTSFQYRKAVCDNEMTLLTHRSVFNKACAAYVYDPVPLGWKPWTLSITKVRRRQWHVCINSKPIHYQCNPIST